MFIRYYLLKVNFIVSRMIGYFFSNEEYRNDRIYL